MSENNQKTDARPDPAPGFRKILVVDDITYVLKSISKVLKDAGYFVMTARTAREALEQFRSYWPDLVTIDQKLPDMPGLTLAKQIRKLDPERRTKIIFISSVYEREEIRQILQQGVDDYLMKPFKRARLLDTVKHVLKVEDNPGENDSAAEEATVESSTSEDSEEPGQQTLDQPEADAPEADADEDSEPEWDWRRDSSE